MPSMEFTDAQASMRSPVGARFPGSQVTVKFFGKPGAAGRREIRAAAHACVVGALALDDRAAVETRMG
jgi:hypothetical protein